MTELSHDADRLCSVKRILHDSIHRSNSIQLKELIREQIEMILREVKIANTYGSERIEQSSVKRTLVCSYNVLRDTMASLRTTSVPDIRVNPRIGLYDMTYSQVKDVINFYFFPYKT